jgi:hypothetical protein
MPFDVPEQFIVYEMDMPGATFRLAVNPDQLNDKVVADAGWRKSADQNSPVYDVLHPKPRGGIDHDHPKEAMTEAEVARWHEAKETGEQQKAEKTKLARDFAAAHKRLALEGRVPDHVAQYRLTVCTGVTQDGTTVSEACPRYVKEEKGRGSGHCRGCGCPDWPISQMHREGFLSSLEPGKAWFPIGCPIGRFSPHPGRRALTKGDSAPIMEVTDDAIRKPIHSSNPTGHEDSTANAGHAGADPADADALRSHPPVPAAD